mmetsp:Transcript_41562/g.131016  ORF Transcript_41562/g.131016 Transcript_41562/m.131016 type:complete len:93 (-) Transcript_41562:19-297(-)
MRLSFYFSSPSSFVSPHLGPPPIASLSRRWKDHESAEPKYWVGMLSKKTRMIRIVNMLTKDEHTVEVGRTGEERRGEEREEGRGGEGRLRGE